LSRFTFRPMEKASVDWIVVSGKSDSTRIDHNDLGPKKVLSNMVMLSGNDPQVVQHTRIDHNYFHDITNTGGNGWEAIRAGLSGLALSSGYSIIEYNLFERAEGDPETISMKSSDSIVRYNTFRATPGEITLRHGNRNLVYGNFMLGGGNSAARGIRVCGQDHKIWNNYIQDITASPSILLEGGDSDAMNQAGTAHYRVYRAQVVYNTVVNSDGIDVGDGHQYAPVDCVIANNIVQGSSGSMISETRAQNPRYLGNIVNPLGGASLGISRPATEIRRIDPLLVKVGDLFKLSSTSPAIGAAAGDFPFVTDDMDGQPRMAPDVGADEFSMSPELIRPLTSADVGPNAP
jgi:poly(beta-D-mannuronate) lyase